MERRGIANDNRPLTSPKSKQLILTVNDEKNMNELITILGGSISGLILVLAIHFCNVLSNTFQKVIVWIIAIILVLLITFPILVKIF